MSRREPTYPAPERNPSPATVCPPWLRRAVITLVVVAALELAGLSVGAVYVYQQQQYVEGRGEYRDREAARLEEQIRRSVCDLLDQLPEGGLLERPRTKYGCGPGIPIDQLTPEEQARLQGQGAADRSQQPAAPAGAPTAAGPPDGSIAPPPTRPPTPTR